MRQKRVNSFFHFLYPGYIPGTGAPAKDAVHIAIPRDGEFVSICGQRYGGEQSCAVFYDPQELRNLADCLYEAADIYEAARKLRKPLPVDGTEEQVEVTE